MTAGMIDTNQNTNPDSVKMAEIPEAQQNQSPEPHEDGHWFHSLSTSEKRFHVLFYFLAGLTGILVVQVIWQIAVLTAR